MQPAYPGVYILNDNAVCCVHPLFSLHIICYSVENNKAGTYMYLWRILVKMFGGTRYNRDNDINPKITHVSILVTIFNNRFIINIFIVLQRYIHPCVCMSVQRKIIKLVIGFPDVLKVICIIYFLSLLVMILLIHTKPSCDNKTTHYNSCCCTK